MGDPRGLLGHQVTGVRVQGHRGAPPGGLAVNIVHAPPDSRPWFKITRHDASVATWSRRYSGCPSFKLDWSRYGPPQEQAPARRLQECHGPRITSTTPFWTPAQYHAAALYTSLIDVGAASLDRALTCA